LERPLKKALLLLITHLSCPYLTIAMYIEIREKRGNYFVIIHDGETSLKDVVAQFKGTKIQAENVARQYAKQLGCFIKRTSGSVPEPELPPDTFAE